MNVKMLKAALAGLVLSLSSLANAGLIGLANNNSIENSELTATLTALGHTVTTTIDGSLDLIISAPGNDTSNFGTLPYLQISDWGQGSIANTFAIHAQGTSVDITLTGTHDILTGLDADWSSFGFWHYGFTSSYIGRTTSIPGLADADVLGSTYNNVLAVSSNNAYIGWNVYGTDATQNDILLLGNTIEFLITGAVLEPTTVPEPSTLAIFALGIMGLASRRFKKQ